jgi:polyvinyl alcohol dehydrogenase (cytochrome)
MQMRKARLLASCAVLAVVSLSAMAGEWPMSGQNIANTSTGLDLAISKSNVSKLQPRWVATLGGDISARAAVVDGVAYVPD